MFPISRPRHVLEGSANAVKSLLAGGGIGLAFLLALPIAGFNGSGLTGLLVGGILGILVGGLVGISSLAVGGYQLIAGVVRTPSAILATRKGQIWDVYTKEYKFYSLAEEAQELTSEKTNGSHRRNHNNKVRDLEFYELLGVASGATAKEIKRGYYAKAKELHPDKNPDDEQAAEKFRKVNVAYQILSDDEKRDAYDAWGSSSINEEALNAQFDPYVFFAILFGSQLVEPYIGELTVASLTDNLMKLGASEMPTAEDIQRLLGGTTKLRKRQLEIAQNLVQRVEVYVNGTQTKQEFREHCQLEAQAISESAFGPKFLTSIGSTLELEARVFLGFKKSLLGWKGPFAWTRRKVRGTVASVNAVSKTLKLVRTASSSYTNSTIADRTSPAGQKELKNIFEGMIPEILELAWTYNVRDITKTLQGACWRVFADAATAHKIERIKKAEALLILGEEFLLQGLAIDKKKNTRTDMKSEVEEIKVRADIAFKISTMKATGGDVPHNSEELINQEKKRAEKRKARRSS